MANLSEILTVCGRPSFVKEAGALPRGTEYGVESREDVYLGYVTALADGRPTERFTKVAAFWGIADDVKTASERWEAYNKPQELADGDYLLVQDFAGTPVRKFAAFDRDSTIKSASALYDNRWRYPYAWRQEAAERCLAKVASFGVQLAPRIDAYIKKAAGYACPSQASIETLIADRYARHSKQPGFTKLAGLLHAMSGSVDMRHDHAAVKVAMAAVDEFDAKLPAHERANLKVAEESLDLLDDELVKVANAHLNDHVTLVNSHIIKVSELRKDVLEAVDPELAKMAADELADVLPTLPKPDADLLIRLQHG